MKIECDGLYRELKPCACHFAIDVLADEREELRERVKAWTEQDDRHLRYEDELKAERDALRERVQKYERALRDIIAVLGPLPVPKCCEGAQAEMSIAHNFAKTALSIPEGER